MLGCKRIITVGARNSVLKFSLPEGPMLTNMKKKIIKI